jgi:hypothetical protein
VTLRYSGIDIVRGFLDLAKLQVMRVIFDVVIDKCIVNIGRLLSF